VSDRVTQESKDQAAAAGLDVQPDPIPNGGPSAHDLVKADLAHRLQRGIDTVMEDQTKRKQYGLDKYNSLLQPFNGRDQLQDAYEEALDLCVYLRMAIEERDLNLAQGLEDERHFLRGYEVGIRDEKRRHEREDEREKIDIFQEGYNKGALDERDRLS